MGEEPGARGGPRTPRPVRIRRQPRRREGHRAEEVIALVGRSVLLGDDGEPPVGQRLAQIGGGHQVLVLGLEPGQPEGAEEPGHP